jgi:putative acetyltransferase
MQVLAGVNRSWIIQMNSITIELATIANAPECAMVLRATRKHSLPYLPDLHTAAEDFNFISNRVFGTDTVFVALEGQKRIVGFIAFREGWVNHLYVLPDFQQLGIGGQLLEKAKKEWPTLNLWTFERNSASRRFYEKHGFSIVKRTDGTENEEREPDILFRWNR